ncbi:DUF1002 domain-containing protein [Macrococcus armenti]|uniref:DUF1002 domain-containing protein n=1 Tax=Macrococcus armenti TaxID=2875764 RepID=UPI001CC8F373|nr:DUF1002 domain-containing protein [Macrococcus armenti]UBH09652.1 DUF1002 domain-containing protein [Macrococcus armenti]UBH11926.1 DUF1002 domain-containing protein [Macrococcus armenti]UBH16457.1 DUF1002 domain-containing protein [Macrococcus armenti]UBH18813.1 DUF1002 domain-containing protein [Macrococcus armenti]UBH21085.1 DUF1002 domain-containing protein [Macrococcus armenti]
MKRISIFLLTTFLLASCLITNRAQAVTQEAWSEAVTVYGAALEQNNTLKDKTSTLLNSSPQDKTTYVYAEDLGKYLNLQSNNDVLKSSIRIKKLSAGSGLTLNINQSAGKITKITEDTYKNALLTAGVTDADVTIAAAEDVTGESALAGVYKAFEAQGEPIDQSKTQVAQEELNSIANINEQNSGVNGYSQEQLNKAIAEAKAEIAKQGGNLNTTEIKNIVIQKIENNGLMNIINENQINIIVNFIENAQNNGIFNGENKDQFINSAKNYVDDIKNSDGFKKATDKAKELGNNITDTLKDESFWDKILNFFQSIIDWIVGLFK